VKQLGFSNGSHEIYHRGVDGLLHEQSCVSKAILLLIEYFLFFVVLMNHPPLFLVAINFG